MSTHYWMGNFAETSARDWRSIMQEDIETPQWKMFGQQKIYVYALVNKWLRNSSPKKYLSSKYGLWDLWTTYVEWLFHWLVLSYILKKKFYTDARYIAQNSHICKPNLWQLGYIWQF